MNEERDAIRRVVTRLDKVFAKDSGWGVELLGWEDTTPGHGRPQDLINADLDKADLFVGCLWRRWGSPSGAGAQTGFEEEFNRALKRYGETGAPQMWLYFKAVDPSATSAPDEQLKKVMEFRTRVAQEKRLLFRDFDTTAAWESSIETFLCRELIRRATGSLGTGLNSTAVVERGSMRYLVVPNGMPAADNMTLSFDGGSLQRRAEGGLELTLRPRHAYPAMTAFQDLIAKVLVLASPSEVLSTNPGQPTVFSGTIESVIPAGTLIPDAAIPYKAAPLSQAFVLHSDAIFCAHLDGSTLRGTLEAGLVGGPRIVRTAIELLLR